MGGTAGGDIVAGDIAAGPSSATAVKSLCKQEMRERSRSQISHHYPSCSLEVPVLVILTET